MADEFVVLWQWESEIPNNRVRFESKEDAQAEAARQQGGISGLVRGSAYPDFKILKRRVETTVVEGTWQVQ